MSRNYPDSYWGWASERNNNIIWDRQRKAAREVKGTYYLLHATANSGYTGYSGPMTYKEAWEEKREHDKNSSVNDPFPNMIEIVEWEEGENQEKVEEILRKKAKKLWGWWAKRLGRGK